MKDVLIHLVDDDPLMRSLSVRTKIAPTPHLLEELFDAGRVAAGGFLTDHAHDLGQRGSVDLAALFG